MNTLFFRLLSHEDKAEGLSEALDAVSHCYAHNSVVHAVEPSSFRQMPRSPFAYWVSENMRRLFTELPPFEGDGRTVKQGLATADDFRFVRAWWEVPSTCTLDGATGPNWREDVATFQAWCRRRNLEGKRWVPFAKGGAYSPYYADLHLVVNWEREGDEIRSFDRAFIRNESYYFRPGLTWPRRTQLGLNMRAYPAGAIFADKGPVAFVHQDDLSSYLGLANSHAFGVVISLQMAFGSYEVGLVQRSPIPDCTGLNGKQLGELTQSIITTKQSLDTADETSHAFVLPTLLQVTGDMLEERAQSWANQVTETAERLTDLQQKIDAVAYQLYGTSEQDQRVIHASLKEEDTDGEDDAEEIEAESTLTTDSPGLITELLSYVLGTTLGRWDIRYATRQIACPELPDPFAPLPVCSPGMLVNAHGLPAEPEDIPRDYPIRISWSGILVDDEGHPDDIIGRVREAFEIIWQHYASEIEHEACDILGVRSLRDYFAKLNNFFANHLKRYSKSRRQAPIYWPLQTPSGSYTLWLYYHRLRDQTLYTCVNDFVEPKLRDIADQLNILHAKTNRSRQEERELERLMNFEHDLKDFRDELLRVARFWKPNLNDGAQITAAPLWKLFQHRPWQRKLKDTWDKLERGDYDWAHLAFSIWPDRVRDRCKHDKSLAIAHDLEELYEEPPEQPRARRRRQRD